MSPSAVPGLTIHKLPLLIHAIVETAAAFTFIFKPSRQLPEFLLPARSEATLPTHPEKSSSYPRPPKTPPPGYNSRLSRRLISSSPSDGIATPGTDSEGVHDRRTKSEEARRELDLILLNYGGLLLTTNFTCLVFLARPVFDELAGLVSLCMASYHVWPVWRAYTRMRMYNVAGDGSAAGTAGNQKFLGGPVLHLVLHLGLLVGLVWAGLDVSYHCL